MSDSDEQEDILKNEETKHRRAWIARALDSVRRRLEAGDTPEPEPEPERVARPQLYVVPSRRQR